MAKVLNKHVSGKTVDAAIELRKLLGTHTALARYFSISPRALSLREREAVSNGIGITKEHCTTLIAIARKRRHELHDLIIEISKREGIPIDEISEGVDEEPDCGDSCRLGKGGEK